MLSVNHQPQEIAQQHRIDSDPVLRLLFTNLVCLPSRSQARGVTLLIGNLLDRVELLESRIANGEYPNRRRIVPTT